jgi:hypothetical protein
MLEDPNAPGRSGVLSQFARPFSPDQPQVMGYSLRTATHRYTRWVAWPSRELLAEELYEYSSGPSARTFGPFLIEEKNMVSEDNLSDTRKQLSRQLDQMLEQRTHFPRNAEIATPFSPTKKKTKKSKS